MRSTGDQNLDITGVKFYADGWVLPRTCALREPFSDEPTNNGVLFLDADTLVRKASPFAEKGWQIATHAIGDRAIVEVLDAYEEIYGSDCAKAAPRIEHCIVLDEDIAHRMSALGVVACIQPSFAVTDSAEAHQALGSRMKTAYRWDVLLDAGVKLIAGSDYPIEALAPLTGLRDLASGEGHVLNLDQGLALMSDAEAGVTHLSNDPRNVSWDAWETIEVLGTECKT